MTVLFFAGLGLIVGSFLNVLILREGTSEGLSGRSHCPHCHHQLGISDLVPVFSWMLLRGQCRYCKKPISLQYPLVEALTAVLFIGIGLAPLSLILQSVGLIIVSLTVAITVYDLRHTLIPDAWNYLFAASALVFTGLHAHSALGLLSAFLGGLLVALPLFTLWAVSRGRWMGLGDVKFALGMGFLLGQWLGFVALLYAFVIGAMVSIFILLPLPYYVRFFEKIRGFTRTPIVASLLSVFQVVNHPPVAQHSHVPRSSTPVQQKTKTPLVCGFTMKSEVPFGPFLVFSCLLLWFFTLYGVDITLLPFAEFPLATF